ncbi:MAG: hypothetical protein SPL99_02480 [Catonella sp.]|nr:hypothetical protein [Catonella sp.]MDY6355892.1 hypothetical protein [Catonella sp.]
MKIISIEEADYGCEELPEGAELMCRLIVEDETGQRIVEIPDKMVDELKLHEGMNIDSGILKD